MAESSQLPPRARMKVHNSVKVILVVVVSTQKSWRVRH
jgi:hypothetical protein